MKSASHSSAKTESVESTDYSENTCRGNPFAFCYAGARKSLSECSPLSADTLKSKISLVFQNSTLRSTGQANGRVSYFPHNLAKSGIIVTIPLSELLPLQL